MMSPTAIHTASAKTGSGGAVGSGDGDGVTTACSVGVGSIEAVGSELAGAEALS
ncbi:hypothetical protein MHH56_17490 [Paenibacillus sp. FSL K6-3182]|uniref:hypothetical protein n=1 Tax=unclassified Paenibacillus TaxID=185978 RepID=UPI0030CD1EBF